MKKENHPVGFRKYILLSLLGYRLRLHVWVNGRGNDSRHNHRWWFVSVPLFGRFVETRYREIPGRSLVKIAVADRNGVRDNARLYTRKGESELEIVARKVRWPLLPYFCPVRDVHSLVPNGGGVHMSIVLCGRPQSEITEIWRRPDFVDVPLDDDENVMR